MNTTAYIRNDETKMKEEKKLEHFTILFEVWQVFIQIIGILLWANQSKTDSHSPFLLRQLNVKLSIGIPMRETKFVWITWTSGSVTLYTQSCQLFLFVHYIGVYVWGIFPLALQIKASATIMLATAVSLSLSPFVVVYFDILHRESVDSSFSIFDVS